GPANSIFILHLVAHRLPLGILIEILGLAVDGEVIEVGLDLPAGGLLIENAEAIEGCAVLFVAVGEGELPGAAVEREGDFAVAVCALGIVLQLPIMRCAI